MRAARQKAAFCSYAVAERYSAASARRQLACGRYSTLNGMAAGRFASILREMSCY